MTGLALPESTVALLGDLRRELLARDPAYPGRFPIGVPDSASLSARLRDAGLDAGALMPAIEWGLEWLHAAGLPIRRDGAEPVGVMIAECVADAVLAGLGQISLRPEPDCSLPLEQVLAARFDSIRLTAGRTALLARGTGPVMLVVSALGVPLDVWRALIADSGGPFRPLFIEGRCGSLQAGGLLSDADLTIHADDLAASLQELGLGAVNVVGWCNGGRIAIDLARRHKDQVRALLLLSPTLRGAPVCAPASLYEDNLEKMFARVRDKPGLAEPLARMLVQLTAAPVWDSVTDPAARARLFLSRPALAHAEALNRPTATGKSLLAQARRTQADEAYPVVEALAALTMKMMVAMGSDDAVVSNATTVAAARQAGAGRCLVVRGAGHAVGDLQYRYLRCVAERFFGDDPAAAWPLRVQDADGAPEWRFRGEGWPRDGVRWPLSRLFGHAAATGPERTALSDGEATLTFAALEHGARRLARQLVDGGIMPGGHVLVLSEKHIVVPVAAGGIWKAGAVYVPVDAENPPPRLASIIGQLGPQAIIGSAAVLVRLAAAGLAPGIPAISFEAVMAGANGDPAPDLGVAAAEGDAAPEDAAYVIFTSGSTGAPKGVVISHRSLLDYFYNHNQVLRFGPDSRVFSLAPFHFDVSIEDTILPLSLGAFVYQFRGMALGPRMRRALQRERITHLIAVSSLLALITGDGAEIRPGQFPGLEMVMTGAETCDPRLIDIWVTGLPHARVINAYGPTEATIVCLTHIIAAPEPGRTTAYPIGLPLQGVTARILDEDGRPIETPGIVGELVIGGTQVMTGYLGRPGDTEAACPVIAGQRSYRTGDFCSWDAQGRVAFAGRRDDTRKIGGRRIDLGEVRQAAQSLDGVLRAAVGLVAINGRDAIGLVVVSGPDPDLPAIRRALVRDLLPYMVPAVIGAASEGWLASSGKTDERSLIRQLADTIADRGAVDGLLLRRDPVSHRSAVCLS